MVLKKGKKDSNILFIDATEECIKVTNNNKLTDKNIDRIVEWFSKREDVDYRAYLATYDELKEHEYNLSVNTYVEAKDTREVIDIKALNDEIKTIVQREEVLRKEIDRIILEIEV